MTSPVLMRESSAVPMPPELAALMAGLEALLRVLTEERAPVPVLSRWIPLKQAAEYTGLSEGLLRRLIQAKLIHGLTDGCTKVLRSQLDSLDPSKLNELPKAKPRKRGARKK